MVGRLYHLPKGEPRARAAELLERFDLADAADRLVPHLLGRHAPPPRPRRGAGRPPAGPLPRRADHRPRPAQPASASGRRSRAGSPSGTTVLLTTQYLDEADRLADRISVIDHGSVIAEGSSDELKDQVGGERLEVTLEDRDHGRRGDRGAGADRGRAAGRRRRPCGCRSAQRKGDDRRGGAPPQRGRRRDRRHRDAPPDPRRRLPHPHRRTRPRRTTTTSGEEAGD